MTEDEQFSYFWDLYNKKLARTAARRAWDRLSIQHRHDACVGLKDRLEHDRLWLLGYQSYPATYLNGQLWLDEWEREIPRAERSDNVRDTTNEPETAAQKIVGLTRFRDQLQDAKQDTAVIDKQIENLR